MITTSVTFAAPRLLIIDSSQEFTVSLENRLLGLEHTKPSWSTATTVAEAWETLALGNHDLILAGLPLPSPLGADLGELATVFSGLPVVGFSDSWSSHYLHPSLDQNVVLVLPRTRLDNRLLEQSIHLALTRATLCRRLESREEAVAALEKRFQNTIVNNADGIVVVDLSGRIRFANASAEELFGASAEELCGERFGHALIPSGSMEIEVLSRDGVLKTVEMRVVQSRWDGGEFVYLASLRDISSRKRLERDLTTMKEAAEGANKAKSQFLANMSHEIRTPMNGILGMTELLLATELSSRQRDYLDMVRQSATSLMEILNDILDFSKIEAGKLELEDKAFDLHATIRSAFSIFTALSQNKGLSMSCNVDDSVPKRVRGDSGRLRQVIVNLVGNAVKFTSSGSVQLKADCVLHCAPETGKTAIIRISVSDTGPGIPQDKLGSIFDSFTQADNSITRKYYGTGLGLAICKQLVQRMDGKIWVSSKVDEGSVFSFEVRLMPVVEPATADKPKSEITPGVGPLTILLAEDNLINQLFATEILEQDGHTVVPVGNGADALELLSRQTVDVVLMDIQMPEMDGLEATRRIRDGEAPGVPRDLPIIAMTAHALKGDRERFLESGMDGYLSKPVGSEEIQAALHEVLSTRRPRKEEPAPEPGPAVLNESWLMEKARGNREFLKKLFAVFVDQQPQKFDEMRQAITDRDMAQLAFMAHTLKGGAATMGAEQLKEQAFELEKAAKAPDPEKAAEEMKLLSEALRETMAAMRRFMGN